MLGILYGGVLQIGEHDDDTTNSWMYEYNLHRETISKLFPAPPKKAKHKKKKIRLRTASNRIHAVCVKLYMARQLQHLQKGIIQQII